MNKLILMRHAEKDSTGQITKKGIEDAFQLGKKLKSKGIEIELIRTSPIERCKKTALELINGYNEEICTIEDYYLGDPGIYIYNDKIAIKAAIKCLISIR